MRSNWRRFSSCEWALPAAGVALGIRRRQRGEFLADLGEQLLLLFLQRLDLLTRVFHRVTDLDQRRRRQRRARAALFGMPPPERLAWAIAWALAGRSFDLALTRMTSSGVSSKTRLKLSGSTKRTVSRAAWAATEMVNAIWRVETA